MLFVELLLCTVCGKLVWVTFFTVLFIFWNESGWKIKESTCHDDLVAWRCLLEFIVRVLKWNKNIWQSEKVARNKPWKRPVGVGWILKVTVVAWMFLYWWFRTLKLGVSAHFVKLNDAGRPLQKLIYISIIMLNKPEYCLSIVVNWKIIYCFLFL